MTQFKTAHANTGKKCAECLPAMQIGKGSLKIRYWVCSNQKIAMNNRTGKRPAAAWWPISVKWMRQGVWAFTNKPQARSRVRKTGSQRSSGPKGFCKRGRGGRSFYARNSWTRISGRRERNRPHGVWVAPSLGMELESLTAGMYAVAPLRGA
jgi:hypothetical protein